MSDRVAVIDVGSNALRLAVFARTTDGGLCNVYWQRHPTRLIAGLGTRFGVLDSVAMEDAIDAIRGMAATCRSLGLEPIAVATSAVRDAANREEFVQRVAATSGVSLQVLSDREEAGYAFLAVVRSLEVQDGLIVEVGGGSAQFIAVANRQLGAWASLPIGAVRLAERFPLSDPPTTSERAAVRQALALSLKAIDPWLTRLTETGSRLVAISGAIRDLVRLHSGRRSMDKSVGHGYLLPVSAFRLLAQGLASWTIADRVSRAGIEPDRADILVPALELLDVLVERLRCSAITASLYGIREGIAYQFFDSVRSTNRADSGASSA